MSELREKLADFVSAATGPTLEIVSETLLDGTVGAVVPGVGNAILSYKQNRMERRIESTLQALINRQEEFNAILSTMQEQFHLQNVKGKYFEMLMDYAIDEPQEEKIDYLVNGYINIARIPSIREDVARNYYDTLSQMNLLDLRVFKIYMPNNNDDAYSIMKDYDIDSYEYDMIREKLARLGLTYSINDVKRDENMDAIVKYLDDINKGKRTKLRVKSISRGKSYRLSSFGNRFIKFIESEYNGENINFTDDIEKFL